MSRPLTREMLETVFAPHELITCQESGLSAVSDRDAREVLQTLGIPTWENPWFDMDTEIGEHLERVGDGEEELTDRYEDVPSGADDWFYLGVIPYDDIAFDPASGKVYCLPQDDEIYLLNSSLRLFVYFLYLLKMESPNYDWESSATLDLENARTRIREAMESLDPAALENPESRWFDILEYIVDPNAHYY